MNIDREKGGTQLSQRLREVKYRTPACRTPAVDLQKTVRCRPGRCSAKFRPLQSPMPTYEYECAKCRKTFEIFQSMKDDALTVCPKTHCRMKTWGRGKVKRLLGTGAGLIFKGSGFYITDYRSDSYKQGAKKDSPAPASTETKKSDAASTAKSPSKPAKSDA
jgi:putative FmdB family regulatory protein